MTPTDFTAWLRGFLSGCEAKRPTLEQWAEIRDKLGPAPATVTVSLHPSLVERNESAKRVAAALAGPWGRTPPEAPRPKLHGHLAAVQAMLDREAASCPPDSRLATDGNA